MPDIAIVDASVLIALEKIDLLDILCEIYEQIILPEAVLKEFGTPAIDCYSITKAQSPIVNLLAKESNLGMGESEALALAYEKNMKIILDDLKARKIAETLNLDYTGTIGLLLKAEELGLIDRAYDKVKNLKEKGFHVSDQLLEDIFRFKIPT